MGFTTDCITSFNCLYQKVAIQQNAGALNMGLQAASGITLMLTFLAYLTPLFGGYISDKKLGRVKTIWYGIWIGALSHVVLIIAAIPSVLKHGSSALAPTIIAIVLLAIGSGLIKPNLLPLLFDQYPYQGDVVKTLKSGKQVIFKRSTSLETMALFFYWAINIGSLFSIATSYSAKRVGFWLAYLIPGIVYMLTVPVLLMLRPHLKKDTPTGVSIIEETLKVLKFSFKKGWYQRWKSGQFWEYAKPSNFDDEQKEHMEKISWNDQFVDDVRVTLDACKIFTFFIIYNINDGGIGGVQNSQAASMTTNGVPNDLISNFNPITICVVIPILDYIVYPVLRRYKIEFRPVHRIFLGFMLASIAAACGAIIQWKVYQTSPCGYYATDCDVGTGVSPISVWVETVLYILQSASECFANTAAYEIAYVRAPDHMKGLVMALFLFMNAISSAISEACTSALVDPHLIWPFVATCIAGTLSAFLFLYLYKDLHLVMAAEQELKDAKREREGEIQYAGNSRLSADFINQNKSDLEIVENAEISSVLSKR